MYNIKKTALIIGACMIFWMFCLDHANAELIRRYIEAEEIGVLQRYPYDNEDCLGWYIREAPNRVWGAPGRGYCVAVHENSKTEYRTISKKLKEVIPQGKYKLFLRVLGPVSSEQETIVIISLEKEAVNLETAISWSDLGVAASTGSVHGFDLYWTDIDKEAGKLYSGTMQWAGGSSKGGYLVLSSTINK